MLNEDRFSSAKHMFSNTDRYYVVSMRLDYSDFLSQQDDEEGDEDEGGL